MERFGLLFLEEEGENIFAHEKLFDDILPCIKEGIAHFSFRGRKLYFKILNNKEIVSHLHIQNGPVAHYGYLHLSKSRGDDSLKVISASNFLLPKLYNCFVEERKNVGSTNCKIAYFAILSDDQIVNELHKMSKSHLKSPNEDGEKYC